MSFGPHSHDEHGHVIHEYRWPGRSPADVPLADLPVVGKTQLFALVDDFDARAEACGYVALEHSRSGETFPNSCSTSPRRCASTPSMASGVDPPGASDGYHYAQHRSGIDYRVSSSFLGHGANLTKCHVGWSGYRDCITVHDYETGITHLPADRKPVEDERIVEIGELLQDLQRSQAAPAQANGPRTGRSEWRGVEAAEELMPPPPPPPGSPEEKGPVFNETVFWLMANYGLLTEGEVDGSGHIVPFKTRVARSTALAAFRTKMLPYRLEGWDRAAVVTRSRRSTPGFPCPAGSRSPAFAPPRQAVADFHRRRRGLRQSLSASGPAGGRRSTPRP